MSENKNINSKTNRVTANLVATYDLSPANASSVLSIDYLCIYEYEYEGKKYKYRTHQRDNFSPVPETIELVVGKDPNKAYKVNNSSHRSETKSLNIMFWAFILGGLILIIYFIYNVVKYVFPETNIFSLLIIICLFIIITTISLRKQKNSKNRDEIIENAMLNNRTVTAYLTKTKYRSHTLQNDSPTMQQYYKERPYKGEYTYEYNGKKYKKSFEFSSQPPNSVRLFFGKNPKDIIHFTW